MSICIGVFGHVDAGKTTLAESLLFETGTIRSKGNIDHQDTFLDFSDLEKKKGITIFNKEALFNYKDKEFIYIDTPGHNDFSYEAIRILKVIDVAILIISSIEELPQDTINIFNTLYSNNIPILLLVNKMDISNYSKEEILNNLKNKLSSLIIDNKDTLETVSLKDEKLLNEYLTNNTIDSKYVTDSLLNLEFIPAFFGSALKDKVSLDLIEYIYQYVNIDYQKDEPLNMYLYRLYNDYAYLKILSGTLNNKDSIAEHKINEIYKCSGLNFTPIPKAIAGEIVAVKGLKDVPIGTYLPSFNSDLFNNLPMLSYKVISNLDVNELYKKLSLLINEFPELNIKVEGHTVYLNLNGELHALIVSNMIKERLDIEVSFSSPQVKYEETILEEVYGVGHFEPLRHYAEAIVNLKPHNGFKVFSKIDSPYINSLLSYLNNYPIKSILTNSRLVNVEIEIVAIKTHPKHTEGRDLIESVNRAIRQALSKTKVKLLEPYYLTLIETNIQNTNTIISYLSNQNVKYSIDENKIIANLRQINFNDTLLNLKSKLKGNLNYSILDTIYDDCLNEEEVINTINYDYLKDLRRPAGSVFCSNGAGHYVEPSGVEEKMHLNLDDYFKRETKEIKTFKPSKINDEELLRVWNNLYKPKPITFNSKKQQEERIYKPGFTKPLVYLIDGYNLMYYLDEELATTDFINARIKTTNMVLDFAGYVNAKVILVYDAYLTNTNKYEVIDEDKLTIVYTKTNETADTYIEHKSKELKDQYKLIVVTSDYLEQVRVFSNNASLLSCRELINRYENFKKNIKVHNDNISYKPFKDLRKLLEED